MEQKKATILAEPRLELLDDLKLIGFSRLYKFEEVASIPDQWQSFAPLIAQVSNESHPVTYGAIYHSDDDSFEYLSGVESAGTQGTPQNMARLSLRPQSYLVFSHPGHVANLRETCDAIWSDWLPASGKTVLDSPWFERYGPDFNPMTGAGGLEIWIPVSA